MKELPFGQITPAAKPIGAFATPAKRNVAGAAKPTLLGDTQKIVRQQMMGVGSYQGYNQWQELSTALGNVGAQVPKFGESLISAMAAENESIGTREAYKAAQNQTARAMISLQNQNELAAGNAGALINRLEKIDPIGAELAETTNVHRLIGRRKVMAQLAAYEIDDILDKDLQDNAEFLSTLPEGSAELVRRKSSLTRQIQKKYGLTGDEPEYYKYVVSELNKSWDNYRDKQSKLYEFELQRNVKNGTVAQVKTLMEGYVKNGVTDLDGNVHMPGSAKWTEIAGISLTTAIDKQLSVLAGKQREDAWKAIREEIIPAYNNEITGSVISEIRLGSARDPWEKRPKLGDSMPGTVLDLRVEGLENTRKLYEQREKNFERKGTELYYAPGGPSDFIVGTKEWQEAIEKFEQHPDLKGWRGIKAWVVKESDTERKYEAKVEAEDPLDLAVEEGTFIDSLTPDKLKMDRAELIAEAKAIAKRYPLEDQPEAFKRLRDAINDRAELYSKLPSGVSSKVRDEVARDLQDKEILKLDKRKGYQGGLSLGLDQESALGRSGTEFRAYANAIKDGYTNAITNGFLEWRTANPGDEPTQVEQTAIIRKAVSTFRASDEFKQLRNQALGLNEKGEKPIPAGTVLSPEQLLEKYGPADDAGDAMDGGGSLPTGSGIVEIKGPQIKDYASGFSDRRVRLFRMQPLMKATWLVDELTNVQQGNSYSPELESMAKRAKVHPDRVLLEQLKFYDKTLDPEGKIKIFLQNRINNRNNNQKVSASYVQGKGNWVANMFFGGPVSAATLDSQLAQVRPPVVLSKEKNNYKRATTNFFKIYDLAKELGIKFPEVAAAQMGEESGWGLTESGKNNYWGLKATPDEMKRGEGRMRTTAEQFTPGVDTMLDQPFKDFDSIRSALLQYKKQWNDDFMGRKGTVNAKTAAEAVKLLKKNGYATGETYVENNMNILKDFEGEYGDQSSIGGDTMVALHDYQKDPYLRKTIMEIINTPGYDPDTVREAQRQLLRMNQGLPRFP